MKMEYNKKQIEKEYLKIEKKWNLTYFCLGFGLGFITFILLIILTAIPMINNLDETNLFQISNNSIKEVSILEDLRENKYTCLSYTDSITLDYSFTGMKKDCNSEGFCKNIFLKWDNDFNEVSNN